MNKEMKDIKKKTGNWCGFRNIDCSSSYGDNCHLKDKELDECVFWLMNNNLYHIREQLEKQNEKLEEQNKLIKRALWIDD